MDPLLLRFLERITVELIGGLSIYLGYRLFLKVPEYKDNEGKLTLPWNISIVMTRVGPGVFFALFGVLAICLSLIRPLSVESKDQNGTNFTYMSGASGDRTQRANSRASMREKIATLNN